MGIIKYIKSLFKKKEVTVENMWEDYHDKGIIGEESYNLIKNSEKETNGK